MPSITIHNETPMVDDYRSNRTRAMFNVDGSAETVQGTVFHREWDLPIEGTDWNIGVVVGPSGSGKTSLGHAIWDGEFFYEPVGWDPIKPIIECILPDGEYDEVTGALAAVGLGDVPAWLRPYPVLSNGEQFRANMAKIVAEAPERVVVDEFSSVVDRQIAKIGAYAFQKAFRRTGGQAVLLTCHYDVLEWMNPDWVFDTAKGLFYRSEKERMKATKLPHGEVVGSLVA